MSANGQEIESKFYVRDLPAVEKKLLALGAACSVPHSFEFNLRFDDAENRLARARQVLRLRKSDDVRLAFKGPGQDQDGAVTRTELEVVVNDFDAARTFLEALGYHAVIIYEKFRSVYELDDVFVMLDELPYGNFVEIEAEKIEAIAHVAQKLGLKPAAAIPSSYLALFEHIRASKNLPVKNLAFIEFEGIHITAEDLGVLPAD